jgi:hypothetical protein
MKKVLSILYILLIILSGCYQVVDRSHNWVQSINIPDADIVFNTISNPEPGKTFGKDILGFYNFKDQSVTLLDLEKERALITPYFLDSHTVISLNKLGNYGVVNEGRAYLLIFTEEYYLNCNSLLGDIFPHRGNVLLASDSGIVLINKDDCSVIKTLLNKADLSMMGEKIHVGSKAVSINDDFIIFDQNFNLIKILLPDKEIFYYQKTGIFPSISPDQTKVSYLALDGIHVMKIDGNNDSLVVSYKASDGDFWDLSRGIPPNPNWSSDSKQIVYHKCVLPLDQHCWSEIESYSIFVYDLETGIETEIIQHGLNPSWNYFK